MSKQRVEGKQEKELGEKKRVWKAVGSKWRTEQFWQTKDFRARLINQPAYDLSNMSRCPLQMNS